MASFFADSGVLEEARGAVRCEGRSGEVCRMRSAEDWRETVGWVTPRRTRLMDVGE
jgi:hypothetical protein